MKIDKNDNFMDEMLLIHEMNCTSMFSMIIYV
jgi:hypothetical protein